MRPGPLPAAHKRALADIPVVVARDTVPAQARSVAPPARSAGEPYRAYKPPPFTRASETASPFSSENCTGAQSA